jgi:hypothetical protein
MSEAVKIVEHITDADRVWRCLEKAISRFNESKDQETLLRPRDLESNRGAAASERAITHRLAFYLESALRDAQILTDAGPLVVDCEYNRHGGALKTLRAEEDLKRIVEKARHKKWDEPDEDGFYVFSVAPDIVVHQRGNDRMNRLVIEVKKATNAETPKYDALKLELFTEPSDSEYGYGYDFGAWVIAEDKCMPADRKLRIAQKWKDGKPIE